MVRIVGALAILSVVQAHLYANYESAHCQQGHGGEPLPEVPPVMNVSALVCEDMCDNHTKCVGFTLKQLGHSWKDRQADCYFLSAANLSQCVYDAKSSWSTLLQTDPPPLKVTTYHLFESKYTGLANKDAGNFKGDTGFIFGTFSNFSKGNPEASMEHNIIEMSEVNVTGWGKYEECNAPGAVGFFSCPEKQTDYCCITVDDKGHQSPANHTKTQLPGVEVNFESLGQKYGFPGFWLSFPKESEGVTWTEKKLRRIAGKCLGNAWRTDAGGCDQCGAMLDKCVADCIDAALCPEGNVSALQATWDRVFGNTNECPDVPYPAAEMPNTAGELLLV